MSCSKSQPPNFSSLPLIPIRTETGFDFYCFQHALLKNKLGLGLALGKTGEEVDAIHRPSAFSPKPSSFILDHVLWSPIPEISISCHRVYCTAKPLTLSVFLLPSKPTTVPYISILLLIHIAGRYEQCCAL